MRKTILSICLAVIMSGCATAPMTQAERDELRSWQERTLKADSNELKKASIQMLKLLGYEIDKNEPYNISTAWKQIAVNEYNKAFINYENTGNGIKVTITYEYKTQADTIQTYEGKDVNLYRKMFDKLYSELNTIEKDRRTKENEYQVSIYKDEFDGYSRFDMQSNKLDTDSPCKIELNAYRTISKQGEISYGLKVVYRGSSWLYIGDGESLILLLDGARMGLIGNGSFGDRDINAYNTYLPIVESARYKVTRAQFEKIINSESAKIKITGKYIVLGQFNDLSYRNLRRFYKEYVKQ